MKEPISIIHVGPNKKAKNLVKEILQKSNLSIEYESLKSDSITNLPDNESKKQLVILHENGSTVPYEAIIMRILNSHPNTRIIQIFDKKSTDKKLEEKISAVTSLPSSALQKLPEILKTTLHDLISTENKKEQDIGLFRTIVGKSPNEIFLMEPETQKFVYANRSMLNSLGFESGEFLSHYFEDLIVDDMRNFAQQMVASLIDGQKEKVSFQVDCLRSDHSYYPAQLTLEKIQEQGKDLILGVCMDLSMQKRNVELLEKEKQKTRELQLSNKYRSTFFANLSHEMRTTLNSTLLLSEILSENHPNNLNNDQLKFISTIQHSTTSLLSLLNEVLDLSKIESGKMSMRPEYVEVVEFCKQLERLFQPVASEKSIRFEFVNDLKNDLPFNTDRLRLEQVLKNLISNALKFTDEGSVKLRVFQPDPGSLSKGVSKGMDAKIRFEVIDTGIGIPENQRETIFQSYIQAEGVQAQNVLGGTGLGLSISREIVELLGGHIQLESEVGKGSTFTVELPLDSSASILKNAEAGKIKLTTAPAAGDRMKPKKKVRGKVEGTVLLVDDSDIHNMALSEFLNFRIKETITADSAKKAFEILETKKIDCIVLDMFLPDANGKEMLSKIKNDDRLSSIPVIIYSGKSISQHEEEELGSMADAIIQKNVMSYKLLLSKVSGVLQKMNKPMN